MTSIPTCKKCKRGMRQIGRYADWTCECCDENRRKCPHRSRAARILNQILNWA